MATSFDYIGPVKSLEYVQAGGGRDISKHKGGREGFEKAIEDFKAAFPSYGRIPLEEKAVVVGDFGVGKSCLLKRYTEGTFPESTKDLGVFKHTYTCRGCNFILCLWDTAGQEHHGALPIQFFRGAQACIVAFDLGVPMTLARVEQWVDRFKRANLYVGDLCVFLVGCKSEMFHLVSDTSAEQVAAKLEAEYFEVSAKSGANVTTLFERVACVVFERALLRHAAEWKQHTSILMPPEEEENSPDQLLLMDLGYGKGTENWKRRDKARRKSICCCCWAS